MPLENPKHERFAQELAKGRTQIDSYVAAGYKPNDTSAARLFRNVRIRARVAEIQEKAAVRVEITAADIARQLDEDRTFARSLNQGAAAVAATMGQAKVLGLIVDKAQVEFEGRVQVIAARPMTDEEFAALHNVETDG